MASEHDAQVAMNSLEDDSPAKNFAAAKNRQRSPTLLNDLSSSSGIPSASPLHFDWQSSRCCVSERIRSLFANTTLADVYFNIHYRQGCDGASTPFVQHKDASAEILVQRIPAHTFILAISSAVFEAMFYGPLSIQNAGASTTDRQLGSKQLEWSQISEGAGLTRQAPNLSPLSPHHRRPNPIYNPSSSQITPNNPIEVHLDDVNPVAFVNVLRYIYTNEVQVDASNVLQTLYVAKKYAITCMEDACVEFLSQAVTVDNALMLLAQAKFFDEQGLAQKCLEVIDKNTAKVFDTEEFLALDKDLLCTILERDSLCIREVRLFVATLNWAKAEYKRRCLPSNATDISDSTSISESPSTSSGTSLVRSSVYTNLARQMGSVQLPSLSEVPLETLRSILAPLLPHVRFPQMSTEEFADVVVPSGVLEDSMSVKIFQHFTASKSAKPELPFVKKPRCYLHGAEEIVRRFAVVDQRWDYRGTSDRIRFKVDRKIFVVGFGLYGSIHGESEYEASIEIVHPESGVVLGSNDVTYLSDGSPSTFRVVFKEPIALMPNTNYLASATLRGQDSYYGTGGRQEVSHECAGGGRVTFHFSYAACMNNGTSVEDGQIPEIIFFV